jgi:hypothetical protein
MVFHQINCGNSADDALWRSGKKSPHWIIPRLRTKNKKAEHTLSPAVVLLIREGLEASKDDAGAVFGRTAAGGEKGAIDPLDIDAGVLDDGALIRDVIFTDNYGNEHRVRAVRFKTFGPP